MIKIGLTGGIGVGKTYVAKIFQKLGIIKLLKIFPNYVPYMMIEFKKIS